jgi:hypothetical protein
MLVLMGIAVINTLSSIRGYFVSKTITQSMINRDLHNHELTTKELRR